MLDTFYLWQPRPLGLDADATDFITRASITDSGQQSAVRQLVTELKANNLWTKLHAFYPLVGGTGAKHSHNLKSSSFQIVWNGTVTHDANGITGDGATGYGDTVYDFASDGLLDDASLGCYCRTQTPTNARTFMGANDGTDVALLWRIDAIVPGFLIGNLNDGNISGLDTAADWRGLLAVSRIVSTTLRFQVRTTTNTQASVSSGTCSKDIALLARGFTGFAHDQFTNANLAAAFMGLGLSQTDLANMETVITTYQTSLGRNV